MYYKPNHHMLHIKHGSDFFWALCRGIRGEQVEVYVGWDLDYRPIPQLFPKDSVVQAVPAKDFNSLNLAA